MVLPTCFIHMPALPSTVVTSGTAVQAELAFASTNTNWFGATSCGLSSCQFMFCFVLFLLPLDVY